MSEGPSGGGSFRVPAEGGLLFTWAATSAVLLLFAGLFVAVATRRNMPTALAVVVVLALAWVPLLVLWVAIGATRRARRFGRPVLHLAQVPVPPGGRLEGAVEARLPPDTRGRPVKLTLACVRVLTVGEGDARKRYEEKVHERSARVEPGLLRTAADGATVLRLAFDIPPGLPGRDLAANPGVAWTLEVRTDAGELMGRFSLPVLHVPAAEVRRCPWPLPG